MPNKENPLPPLAEDPTETGYYRLILSPDQFRTARDVLATVGITLDYSCEFELGEKAETYASLGTVEDIIIPQLEADLPEGMELVDDISVADLRHLMLHYANDQLWTESREVDGAAFAEAFPHLVKH